MLRILFIFTWAMTNVNAQSLIPSTPQGFGISVQNPEPLTMHSDLMMYQTQRDAALKQIKILMDKMNMDQAQREMTLMAVKIGQTLQPGQSQVLPSQTKTCPALYVTCGPLKIPSCPSNTTPQGPSKNKENKKEEDEEGVDDHTDSKDNKATDNDGSKDEASDENEDKGEKNTSEQNEDTSSSPDEAQDPDVEDAPAQDNNKEEDQPSDSQDQPQDNEGNDTDE